MSAVVVILTTVIAAIVLLAAFMSFSRTPSPSRVESPRLTLLGSVSLLGNYVNSFSVFRPRAVVELDYRDFRAGTTALDEEDGFARAMRSLVIRCTDPDDVVQEATIRWLTGR